jgi:outer membrane protein TolC
MYFRIIIKRCCWFLNFAFLLAFTISVSAKTCTLSLNEYLNQVCEYNRGLHGSTLIAMGAKQRVGEGKLIMRPRFFAEGQYLTNTYNPGWAPVAGTSNELQTYQAGISQTTPYGVEGKLYYNYQHQTLHGVSPLLNQANSYSTSSPVLELSVPLARNFAGKETRATQKLIDSRARLTQFSEQFKTKQLLAEAETAYWRLTIARAIVRIQHESLDRSVKIEQWVSHRADLRLAENADTLQAAAAVSAKELDVEVAINDACLAARAFNTLRGSCQDNVYESLCSYQDHLSIALPEHAGPRDDVRAAKAEEQVAIANAMLGIEKNKPNIDLFASYTLNGNDPNANNAISQSFTNNYPSTAIGLRLSVPLDLRCLAQFRSAYMKEIKGSHEVLEQKEFESQRQWQDLTIRLTNAKKRFDLATQLENIQAKKLQSEKERLTYGKTTTYQVLMFEQDYANAQISRLVIQNEIYSLIAQLKTYGVC